MSLSGTDEALFVLSALNNATHFSLTYEGRPLVTLQSSTSPMISPLGYACVLIVCLLVGLALTFLPVYFLCCCKVRRAQRVSPQESQLMVRPGWQDAEAQALEKRVMTSLQALPTGRWKQEDHQPEKGDDADACCFCLEKFHEEDILRILPCGHFFHQACIDDWFALRCFMPRSCPLCKRNPIAPLEKPPDEVGASPLSIPGSVLPEDSDDSSGTSSEAETDPELGRTSSGDATIIGRHQVWASQAF
eukprot:CAMPEP_0197639506 /NCGR_PEP_ID=MMETSP1338-20131121/14106_1 /TAXON_ID=43686 ORGANISM="Pelagodinium beii, Strain RCC1491" /NCGR_SAMPLE_ID=MMETSP1338 /ASSEMBLY_ACC=CAM_ASM_000754 /LENGTH=246 /DNA_ID=CAMNT_0043212237 /DNA_START=396 /DNA_END=1136 /DNA_ORIENTATION=+